MPDSPRQVRAIVFADGVLQLLDQRALPAAEQWLTCRTVEETAGAIRAMVVRGAPAIGIAAAYGMAMAAAAGADREAAEEHLVTARPTAVNLHWALARLRALGDVPATRLAEEARAIHAEDLVQNQRMAEHGAALLGSGARVLTHCNTGALATGGHGTALGVIRTAWAAGQLSAVYHTETRPWLQGARLTAWELAADAIPATMIADAACAQLMAAGALDWVIVGADRVAANGDTANKIGTLTLAACARAFGVKLMVVAPSGTVDVDRADGAGISIEERDGAELRGFGGIETAPAGTACWNPVFDVTPARMIDAFVCEQGVARPCAGEHPGRFRR